MNLHGLKDENGKEWGVVFKQKVICPDVGAPHLANDWQITEIYPIELIPIEDVTTRDDVAITLEEQ